MGLPGLLLTQHQQSFTPSSDSHLNALRLYIAQIQGDLKFHMCILNYGTNASDALSPDAKTFYRPFVEGKYSTLGNTFFVVVGFRVSAIISYTTCFSLAT